MFNYIYHGTKTNAKEVEQFLQHCLESNALAEAKGRRKTPICIWGNHGIGKTELVEQYAQKHGLELAYIAPAQFEEMGDLLGMPKVIDGKTVFAAPKWVPTEAKKGILLIDDVNRADDRILRGIMQLLQHYRLVSWALPAQWDIILTANPDGGDYSVTPMDDAMLTRMRHITLEFEVKTWAKWAEQNEIDVRGINFVLTYPELITGKRTTPRSLVQFFESIATIENLKSNLPLVQLLGDATLEEETVTAFIAFVNQDLTELIAQTTILNTLNFEKEVIEFLEKTIEPNRVDIWATLCTRLINYATLQTNLNTTQLNNLKSFIQLPLLPDDLRFAFVQDLVASDNLRLKRLVADPVVGRILLSGI